MGIVVGLPLMSFADAAAASNAMRSFVDPIMITLCSIAGLVAVFFIVIGGIEYMSSRGNPDKLAHAKRTLVNALVGVCLVIAAVTLTLILSHAYHSSTGMMADKLPTLTPIQQDNSTSFWDVVTKAIVHVLQNIVNSIGQPFVQALGYFTNATPLMGDNSSVFNLWTVILGIADVLFIVVVALLGFHIMSFSTLGFDELDIKQVLPQMVAVFLLINVSIFAIDGIITFSNGMIHALQSAFPCTSIWDLLQQIIKQSGNLGLGGLLVMIAFLVLTVMLLVYYVGRLITLYIGAVLSPLVLLLYMLPAFKDFAITALKIYLTTIFVLFVQVVIMQLASSIFSGMLQGDNSGQPNTLMALIVGLATVLALLKTQGVMKELSYAASTPRAAREMVGTFARSMHSMNRTRKMAVETTKKTKRRAVQANDYIKKKRGIPVNDSRQKGSEPDEGVSSPRSRKPLKTGEAISYDGSYSAEDLGMSAKPKQKKRKTT